MANKVSNSFYIIFFMDIRLNTYFIAFYKI